MHYTLFNKKLLSKLSYAMLGEIPLKEFKFLIMIRFINKPFNIFLGPLYANRFIWRNYVPFSFILLGV